MDYTNIDEWFVKEVLPLEGALMRFLRRNGKSGDDLADLRQEVYVRMYESALKQRPQMARAFVFSTARNLLIDQARRSQIVSIEAYADLDMFDTAVDDLTPERHAIGFEELRMLQDAMEELPGRCREVIQLRKIDGISQREAAAHMGITEDTIEKQISKGIRALADALLQKGVELGMVKAGKKLRKAGNMQ